MKAFLDIGAIVLFFTVYITYNIFYATAAMMIFYSLFNGIYLYRHYQKHRTLDKTSLITWIIILVLGGLTLGLHNEEIIKFKPTIVYWFFASAFLINPYFRAGQPIMQRLMASQISLPSQAWLKMDRFWMVFFGIVGALNLYIAHHYTTQEWVYFKTFGIIGLLLVATVAQVIFLAKHIK
jgi:intracellular septation protein